MKQMPLRMSDELCERIEEVRGLASRNAWIIVAIEQALGAPVESGAPARAVADTPTQQRETLQERIKQIEGRGRADLFQRAKPTSAVRRKKAIPKR